MVVSGFYWPPEWPVALLTIVGVLIARKIRYAIAERRERRAREERRLAADADYEHWHALFGDELVATFGRFQP